MTTTLTDETLAALLAPVPLPVQQRDAPVVVNLRPDLPPDYAGPVELADLRLQASPWHWLRTELAVTPRSRELAKGMEATSVADAADEVFGDATDVHPSDNEYWGHTGSLDGDMDGFTHFLHPAIQWLDIIAWFDDDDPALTDGVVALQLGWSDDAPADEAPLGLFGNAPGRGIGNDGTSPYWLKAAGSLLLANATTGEWAELTAGELPDEEGDESDDNPAAWQGHVPVYDLGRPPAWLAGGLRYAAGHLYHAATGQTLTLNILTRKPDQAN